MVRGAGLNRFQKRLWSGYQGGWTDRKKGEQHALEAREEEKG
jgi:hypothetical protein